MTIFNRKTIEEGIKRSKQITDAYTRITREGIARGETPPLLGALTAGDLLQWIENLEKKQSRR